jgi:CheY-like chemotaxis protein
LPFKTAKAVLLQTLGTIYLMNIINDTLDLSKLEAGKTSLKTPATSVLRTEVEALNGIKILVAEDDAFNQKIIETVLNRLGASHIVLANNGSEALSALEQEDFDLVLMDIHMPIMNGYEATTKIRERPNYAKLPVIALSASSTAEDIQRCLAAGMTDFIGKPVNTNTLLSTLKKYLI